MTDEEIRQLYIKGNSKSHEAGLRAVYEAGRSEVQVAPEVAETKPFTEMTNPELRAYLDSQGVYHTSSDNKSDLERMARAAKKKEV